ncbi:MAG: hypothetical protein KJ970_07375 [Candidatus Eisenbacteria bacterium]|uniref:Uncharacterized protein n=1 Tax=Eiseniibacteriota bacterium TaxID=2212470 RepID=A0A948RW28_UNCEI|nr:hypothetical protein [Candidatus Eisenbacteria bacterium]
MVILALTVGIVSAGPNEGVVLAVQGNVLGQQVDSHSSPCDIDIPVDCEDMDTHAVPYYGASWYLAVVVSPPENTPNFSTVVFGLGDFNMAENYIAFTGSCVHGALEVTTAGWPGPGEGTAMSWAPDCLYGYMEPVYYFGTYNYNDGVIPLGVHPVQGGVVVNCSEDPEMDSFEGFGAMEGDNPACPFVPEPTPAKWTTWGRIKGIYR